MARLVVSWAHQDPLHRVQLCSLHRHLLLALRFQLAEESSIYASQKSQMSFARRTHLFRQALSRAWPCCLLPLSQRYVYSSFP